jgi:hopanoid biosynthesis associated RND transporter like protein HpnN
MVKLQHLYSGFIGMIQRHPLGVILAAVLGVGLSLLLATTRLALHTNRLDLIAAGERYKQLQQAYDREFEELPEGAIVVIRSENPERATAFATALAQRWQTDPNIDQVLYRINGDALKHKALWYLSPEDLIALQRKLEQHQDLLRELAASPTLENLFVLINREMTQALVGHVFTGFLQQDEPEKTPPDLSLLLALLRQMNQWLDGPRVYQSPWATVFMKDAVAVANDGFLWSDDKRLLFVLVKPKMEAGEFNRFKGAVLQMRADVRALQQTYPDVEAGITGKDVLDADEMGVAQRDTMIATMLSAVGVTLLYVAVFTEVARPVLALATLVIGACWALGLTTLTIGHLNIFSIIFMPMLMGLGIDYGSYFIARYEEEKRAAGKGAREALAQTFIATGPGIATTALTTALTFGTLSLTGSKGIAELGFIGGTSIVLTFLATYLVLPALLALHERRRKVKSPRQMGGRGGGRGDYLELLYRYPWATLTASALLVGLSLLTLGRVGADFNLLHLQAQGTESVIWEQRMFENTKRSLLFGEVAAGSLAEVTRKAAALKALSSVAEVESIASVIPEEQARKGPLIQELRPLLADIALQRVKAESVDLAALGSILERIKFKMEEEGEAAREGEDGGIRPQMHEVRRLIDQFVETTAQRGPAEVRQALSAFQGEVGRDLEEKLALLQGSLQAEPVTLTDLPPELRARYIGKTGTYRLFVYPSEDVWEFPTLAQFVADLRSVDADVLGTPVMHFEFIRGITEAYQEAGLYAFLGIVFLALLAFRTVRPALLALVPLAVGSLWTLGLMGLLQVKFNVANLIVLPLIMAPAVEGGIMIVYRYREESRKSQMPSPLPQSLGRAVTFSSLSTIIGFGSLMISRHWGIFSIGLLLTLGVSAVLLASLTVLPSLLRLLSWRREERG